MINPLKRIQHFFLYEIKLQRKMLFSHIILALAPTLLITIFCYNLLIDSTTTKTLASLNTLSIQTKENISTSIDQIDHALDSISNHPFFSSFVYSLNPLRYAAKEDFEQQLEDFISYIHVTKNSLVVSDIRIYLDPSHLAMVKAKPNTELFAPIHDIKGTYWHGIMSNTLKNDLLCPPMYLGPHEVAAYGTHAKIHRLTSGTSEAYVVIYFDENSILPILQQDLPYNDSVIYITNSRDAIVATTDSVLSGAYYLKFRDIPSEIPTTTKLIPLDFAGKTIYCGYKMITGTDWYMVTAVPETNLLSEGTTLIQNFILWYVLIVVISIIIAYIISHSITGRIARISEKMQQVRSSMPEQLDEIQGHDEVSALIDSYNYMTNEIHRLVEEQELTSAELRNSEFRALQAQINPHFLYNTLDMINWMSKTGEVEKISTAVTTLSRFYKITLSRGNSFLSVQEELEHANLYVQLQNMRFNNKIHLFIDVPDEMLSYQMPKLIFQPIIENSILHGILEKPVKEGNIVIMGWLEDEVMVFVISDDGVGIAPEKLSTILSGIGQSSTGSNIAIYNTHKRIQLCYGTEYGLSYRSIPGETEVEIRIPITNDAIQQPNPMLSH